jgi:predicted TIM-barrel fold metal-dependent hydrolase
MTRSDHPANDFANDFARIDAAFKRALSTPPEDRDAAIAEACGGDDRP